MKQPCKETITTLREMRDLKGKPLMAGARQIDAHCKSCKQCDAWRKELWAWVLAAEGRVNEVALCNCLQNDSDSQAFHGGVCPVHGKVVRP